MIGPGRYDQETREIQAQLSAGAIMLFVVDGERGTGFSVVGPVTVLEHVPRLLRKVADDLERQAREGLQGN